MWADLYMETWVHVLYHAAQYDVNSETANVTTNVALLRCSGVVEPMTHSESQ